MASVSADVDGHLRESLYHNITQQLLEGKEQPTLSVTTLAHLPGNGILDVQMHLEEKFKCQIEVSIDMIANSAKFLPILASMEKKSKLKDSQACGIAKGKATKVPRPANAWIIYRRENHAKFVAKHPGVSNNDISKLVAAQWHAESSTVQEKYRQKALKAKVEHALLHPEYQYQPRRSAELKRRMTQRKRQELAARLQGHPSNGEAIIDVNITQESGVYLAQQMAMLHSQYPNLTSDFPIQHSNSTSDGISSDMVSKFPALLPCLSAAAEKDIHSSHSGSQELPEVPDTPFEVPEFGEVGLQRELSLDFYFDFYEASNDAEFDKQGDKDAAAIIAAFS